MSETWISQNMTLKKFYEHKNRDLETNYICYKKNDLFFKIYYHFYYLQLKKWHNKICSYPPQIPMFLFIWGWNLKDAPKY